MDQKDLQVSSVVGSGVNAVVSETLPAEHILKTWPTYFDAVARGEKTFEGRRYDRGFQKGDTVVLQRTREDAIWLVELDASGKPKHELRFTIGFVLHGGQFGIQDGYCVFSLLPLGAFNA